MNYTLMHKDVCVADLEIDPLSGLIGRIKVRERKQLPIGTGDAEQLRKWWLRRATPISQGNLRQVLQENDIATPQSLLVHCLGLSLNDHYWICPVSSGLNWKNVSLFSNPFSHSGRSFLTAFSESLSDHTLIALSPSGSMSGEMQKKWIIEDGKRRLLKRGTGTCQQAVNEVIAAMIHSRQGKFPFVQYELCQLRGDIGIQTGCLCDCFTSETLEFVPAFDVMNAEKKRNDVSWFQHYIDVCANNGLDATEVRAFLEYQILSDFVITNTDRHFNNFGVLRDSGSLQFVSIAPIFDSGNSMFWANPKAPRQADLLDIPVNSFRNRECDLLRYVTQPELLELSKLPTRAEVEAVMRSAELTDTEMVLDAYEQKIQFVNQFQHGVPLRSPEKSFEQRLQRASEMAEQHNRQMNVSYTHPEQKFCL